MTNPRIFVHSWLPDDTRKRLDQKFDLDIHNSFKSILSGQELIDKVRGSVSSGRESAELSGKST